MLIQPSQEKIIKTRSCLIIACIQGCGVYNSGFQFSQTKIKVSLLPSSASGAETIGKIKQLSESTVNKIAAGEVVERPASVVKELVENAIDAGSTAIDIEIEDAGLKLIKITDNGIGIRRDDLEIAFKKHSTSKIFRLEDLDNLDTLGFRGEALPSIASVSRLEIVTKLKNGSGSSDGSGTGTKLVLEAGKVISLQDTGCPEGTIIKIKDLFFNVPARKKFLKQPRTEVSHITEWIMRFALAYPAIRFRLVKNGTEVLSTPATGELEDAVASIFGASFARELIAVEFENGNFSMRGFIGKPVLARRDTSYQFIFVNGRFVTSKLISRALAEAYHTMLMKNRFPTAVLDLRFDPAKLDVNIHPTKLMIRFMDEKAIYPALVEAIKNALTRTDLTPDLQLGELDTEPQSEPVQKVEQVTLEPEGISAAPLAGETEPGNIPEEPDRIVTDDPLKDDHKDILVQGAPAQVTLEGMAKTPEVSEVEIDHSGAGTMIKHDEILIPDPSGKKPVVYRPIGQVHDSYLIIQTDTGMLIVDQHALHERVMYEKYRNRFESMSVQQQELIVPVSLEYNSRDYEMLLGYSKVLKDLGFDIEPFGKNTLRIRAVPIILGRLEDRDVLNDMLDDLLELGRIKEEELMREKIIQIMACKSAVKAGEKMEPAAIRSLLGSIPDLKSPFTCAHGRPTILSLSLKELEKQFKRTGG